MLSGLVTHSGRVGAASARRSSRTLIAAALAVLCVGVPVSAQAVPVDGEPPTSGTDIVAALRDQAYAEASYAMYAYQASAWEQRRTEAQTWWRASLDTHEQVAKLGALSGIIGDDAANLTTALQGRDTLIESLAQRSTTASAEGCAAAVTVFADLSQDLAAQRTVLADALLDVRSGEFDLPLPEVLVRVDPMAGAAQCAGAAQDAVLATIQDVAYVAAQDNLFAAASARVELKSVHISQGQTLRYDALPTLANLGGTVGTTDANLVTVAAQERNRADVTYPAYATRAAAEGQTDLAILYRQLAAAAGTRATATRVTPVTPTTPATQTTPATTKAPTAS